MIPPAVQAMPAGYAPSPMDMTWQIYVGFVAGVFPFALGAWEFGKRIVRPLIASHEQP